MSKFIGLKRLTMAGLINTSKFWSGQAEWCRPVIPAIRRLRQEDVEF
jgi:hypothetical protein